MTIVAKLSIHIEQFLEGEPLEFGGAVADIIPLDDTAPIDDAISDSQPVPAGQSDNVSPAVVTLPAGKYMVQIRLPSGNIVNRMVRFADDDDQKSLVIRPESSSEESTTWQSYLGELHDNYGRLKEGARRLAEPVLESVSFDTVSAIGQELLPDDLTRIRGVGPTIARQLNNVGIERLDQIAKISKQELGWLTNKISSVRGRIDRDDWIGQASDLLKADESSQAPEIWREILSDESLDEPASPAELDEPLLRYIAAEEGAPPSDGQFYQALKAVMDANRSGAQLLDQNASQLIAALPSPVEADPGDLAEFGEWETDEHVSIWRLRSHPPEFNEDIVRRSPHRRIYILADDGHIQWLSALPFPWMRDNAPVRIDVTIDREQPARTSMSILPRDGRTAALLGFLRSGDSRAARSIVRHARSFLFEKVENPFAAAAGCYVLVNNLRWGSDRSSVDTDWFDWTDNLASWYPWLPDATILQAWLRLLTREEKLAEARDGLLRAARGGLPTFSGCFRLLVEGLKMFRDHAEEQEQKDEDVVRALQRLDLPDLRIDRRQVFTTVRLTPYPRPLS